MKQKTFLLLLFAIVLIGSIATVALMIYTYHLYSSCSITSFIAQGR